MVLDRNLRPLSTLDRVRGSLASDLDRFLTTRGPCHVSSTRRQFLMDQFDDFCRPFLTDNIWSDFRTAVRNHKIRFESDPTLRCISREPKPFRNDARRSCGCPNCHQNRTLEDAHSTYSTIRPRALQLKINTQFFEIMGKRFFDSVFDERSMHEYNAIMSSKKVCLFDAKYLRVEGFRSLPLGDGFPGQWFRARQYYLPTGRSNIYHKNNLLERINPLKTSTFFSRSRYLQNRDRFRKPLPPSHVSFGLNFIKYRPIPFTNQSARLLKSRVSRSHPPIVPYISIREDHEPDLCSPDPSLKVTYSSTLKRLLSKRKDNHFSSASGMSSTSKDKNRYKYANWPKRSVRSLSLFLRVDF